MKNGNMELSVNGLFSLDIFVVRVAQSQKVQISCGRCHTWQGLIFFCVCNRVMYLSLVKS